MYLILTGEAWEFKPKTSFELGLDETKKKNNNSEEVRFIETIKLAKISNDRKQAAENRLVETLNSSKQGIMKPPTLTASTKNGRSSILLRRTESPTFENNSSIESKEATLDNISMTAPGKTPGNGLPSGKFFEELPVSPVKPVKILEDYRSSPIEDTRISPSFIESPGLKPRKQFFDLVKNKTTLLTFENNYVKNIVKRNIELGAKYLRNHNLTIKYHKKYVPFDVIGEAFVDTTNIPEPCALFAYTGLDVLVLDQSAFERVFSSQTGEIKDKILFFRQFLTDCNYNILKRTCFLFKEQRYKINELVYKEDSPSDDLYFIKSGEVQVTFFLRRDFFIKSFSCSNLFSQKTPHLLITIKPNQIKINSQLR